jgi:2-dehydropantoate 2-reductase
MRFVVLGAGAIGGTVGGRLAQHGYSVILIARGDHYDAIRDRGLSLESPDNLVVLDIPVIDRPSGISWTDEDILLLATKTQDTDAALDGLAAVAPHGLPIFCVQNSVANEEKASRRFSDVYGVFVWCPADYLTPGVIQVWCAPKSGILHVGRYPSGSDTVAENVASAFRHASFFAEAKPDIMRWKYRKLLSNLGNAVDALCEPETRSREIVTRAQDEALACFRAAGIEVVRDEEDNAARLEREVRVQRIKGVKRRGGSTWQSLERSLGTVETDYLNGAIVDLGRRYGVPTPVNAVLQQLSQQAARERHVPRSLTVEQLMMMIKKEEGIGKKE